MAFPLRWWEAQNASAERTLAGRQEGQEEPVGLGAEMEKEKESEMVCP